ncbi:glycosyltransferase family 1 protein [Robertmurraya sp. FSL W8-0741]|uniref:glycosyltransferase family 4 protein n=1 Tax=Robertmurraya sp. FSL W8-0741 TaxID=2954629 RepID=UPI000BA65F2D|nr:glycosyl transferase [Bacillus sp. 7504-2]
MKIAIFTDTFTPQVNGVALTFQRFVDYLDKVGIEYRLFVPDGHETDLFSNQIFRFTSYPFFLYPECRLALPNVIHIKKELEQFQPDIIHVATPFNIGLAGIYYAKKLEIPLVGSYHTHFDRYLQYYDLQFLSKFIWKYLRWFHRSFKKTFVPSYETKTELINRGFTNVDIWSRGVDCSLFHPHFSSTRLREQYKITEPYILSYVGRLAPEKDLDVLMEIAKRLPSHIQNKVHWIIAGNGPLYEELQGQKLANMTFTGYIKGENLAELYAVSDLFVFPSSTETFGNVVLESFACGTPVVGAKAGGVQEIIEDGRTGKLCQPGNVTEFVESITELVNKQSTLKLMSLEARNYALGQSWERIFSDLLMQYEGVVTKTETKRMIANL